MSQTRSFGNFELTEKDGEPEILGTGSFGKTYRGKHRFLDTEVAIKVIRQRYSDSERYKKTFLQEAKLVAQLNDAHIVRILDFGEQENRLYYVMDFCDGGTLKDLAASSQKIEDTLIVEIARQAAQALICAHRQGIIHRDFKPENIMLASSDQGAALHVKLIDFGLARTVANISGFAEALEEGFHGTPMFSSPEQLREEPLDGRSDLFSLGMTLWWLALGGRLPFGSEKETVTERLSPEGYFPLLQETLSSELVVLLSGLLEKDARSRHASAEEFLDLVNETFPSQVIPMTGKSPEVEAREPARAERRTGRLEEYYRLVRKVAASGHGAYYEALPINNGSTAKRWLWVFEPEEESSGSPEWRLLFEQRMAVLQSIRPVGVSIPFSYEEFDRGALAYSLSWHTGSFLGDGYEGRHQFTLGELMDGLERITRAADELISLGLPMPEFSPESIEWTPGKADFAPLLPTLVEESGETLGTAHSGTLNPDEIRNLSPAARFVMLIYPLIASRRFPMAALYSPSAYVTVPAINESSNRYLMEWACSESPNHSLSSLLATLLASEGLKEHSVFGVGSRGQSIGTARSGFSGSRSLGRFPTRQGSVGSLDSSVSSTVESAPSVSIPLGSHDSPESQPTESAPTPHPPALPVSERGGKKRTALPLAIIAGTLAVILGGSAFWYFVIRANPPEEVIVAPPQAQPDLTQLPDSEKVGRQSELKRLFSRPDRVEDLEAGLKTYISRYGTDDPFVAEAQSFINRFSKDGSKPIKIPGDIATLAEAMERVVEGQTIELAPGIHEAQVICKPGIVIKGQSSGSTTLRMPASGSSILSIRGGKTVYLENLTLSASFKESNSPPLVSLIGGALSAENCVFKDNGGDGISVSSKGRLDLSSCEVTRCDGHGIRFSGASVASLTDCEIHQNGLSGVHAAPSGVELAASRCKFNKNTEFGIEAEGEAKIRLTGGSCSENVKSGLTVSGLGTLVTADGVIFSRNANAGISCINAAAVVFKACTIEENKGDGMILTRASTDSEVRNTTFASNAISSLTVLGQSAGNDKRTLVIESCRFLNANVALAASGEGVAVSVRGESEFANNSLALLSASGARIEMTGGILRFNSSTGQEGFAMEDGGIIDHSEVKIEQVE